MHPCVQNKVPTTPRGCRDLVVVVVVVLVVVVVVLVVVVASQRPKSGISDRWRIWGSV